VYFGADDNLESGEHDGSPLMSNGPSDGGAIMVKIDPAAAAAWVGSLQNLDVRDACSRIRFRSRGEEPARARTGSASGPPAVRRLAYLGGKLGAKRDAPN
jgi:hypothetical protein